MPAKKDGPKTDALNDVLSLIQKKFGKDAAKLPSDADAAAQVHGAFPTGVDVLDKHVLAVGGLPWGRITEVFSEEGGGKTSFAWSSLGAHQRTPGVGITGYCDAERSYDSGRMAVFGIDEGRLALCEPFTMEEALGMLELLIFKAPPRSLFVWDSLASQQPGNEEGSDYTKATQDNRAYLIGRFMRAVTTQLAEKESHLLVINQTRHKRGVMFGPATTTPGGNALKFQASLRVQLFTGKAHKDSHGQHTGKNVTFLAVKTRFSPPFRKAKVRLNYATGWDNMWSTIHLAKELGLIEKASKFTPDSYLKAVKAFGWDTYAPVPEALCDPDDDGTDDEIDMSGAEADE